MTDLEHATGVRFSWNYWPATRSDAQKIVVPVGCMYTPLKRIPSLTLVGYDPVQCRTRDCPAVLNPHCAVDYRHKFWVCPFCAGKNAFPPHYAAGISEAVRPSELIPESMAMEYVLPTSNVGPPVFLFVIDTVMQEAELEQIKDSVMQAISLLPTDSLVGLITFGAVCYVHELAFSELPKSYAFKGTKPITAQQLSYQLGFAVRNDPRGTAAAVGAKRFLMPASECEYSLSAVLEDLRRDQWPVATGKRAERCTGVAISVAQALLETTHNQHSGRILMMLGGPCTIGPGMVVGTGLEETIRSHTDLQKNEKNARYSKEAVKFYSTVSQKAVAAGHAIDVFVGSLDQVGVHEMRSLSERSGGCLVMSDSFSVGTFKDSLRKLLEPDATGYLQMGFNARVEIVVSKDLKVCGAIGAMSSLQKKGASVSETEIGESGTTLWSVAALDHRSSYAFYFEPISTTPQPGRYGYIQFQTYYNHPSGKKHLRVATIRTVYADSSANLQSLAIGFDQEAAAALMARYAVVKCESEESLDVLRWVDRMLIRLVSRFADYRKDDMSSFHLAPEFSLYPQFMYHLRRGPFLTTFGSSPDESAFYRTVLLRDNVFNSLIMIQPTLKCYSFDSEEPFPVILDASSLKPNIILLLDTYFNLVVWKGETIHTWFEQGYHEREEYANFKALLEKPDVDAKAILADRFPVPRYIATVQGGSQARFLTSRVNPSVTHNTQANNPYGAPAANDSSMVLTDDVSLRVFMEHLIKLAVQS
jgi:protein transport protein SEC23